MTQLNVFDLLTQKNQEISDEIITAISDLLSPTESKKLIDILKTTPNYRREEDWLFLEEVLLNFLVATHKKKLSRKRGKKSEKNEDYPWDNPEVLNTYTLDRLQKFAQMMGIPIRYKGKALSKARLIEDIKHQINKGYQYRFDYGS